MSAAAMSDVRDLGQLRARIAREPALLAYFSTPDCGVCRVLKPRILELLAARFPRIASVHVDCAALPEAAAQFSVFNVPTVLAYFDGREWARKTRSFGLEELAEALARPYAGLFGEGPGD